MHLCLVCQTNNDNNPIIIVEERGCCHYLIGNHRSMIIEIRIYILLYERGIYFFNQKSDEERRYHYLGPASISPQSIYCINLGDKKGN